MITSFALKETTVRFSKLSREVGAIPSLQQGASGTVSSLYFHSVLNSEQVSKATASRLSMLVQCSSWEKAAVLEPGLQIQGCAVQKFSASLASHGCSH